MASRGVNKVILVGNLGNDPEVRYMPNGNAVANVSLATSDSWKDKNTGDQQERTEWHRVVFFNRLAEIVEQYVKKGSKIYVEGRLQTRSWEQEGVKRYTTEIVASEMQMLGGFWNDLADLFQRYPRRSQVTRRPSPRASLKRSMDIKFLVLIRLDLTPALAFVVLSW